MPGEMHEALWLLYNLHYGLSDEDWLINIRCIHNKQPVANSETGRIEKLTEVTLDEFVKIKDFKQVWDSELYAKLVALNTSTVKPSNVYFSVNPLLKQGHKKEHFAGMVAFYLDLDDNNAYSKEKRWSQIYYWTLLGYEPSIVIDSGHGFHVYWILSRLVSRETGEAILRRMVALAGCRDKGNTWDISRVLRLPGFANVKEWYASNTPPCGIVWPPDWQQRETARKYDPEHFESFPPSDLVDLKRYYDEAAKVSANADELKANIDKVMHAVRTMARSMRLTQAGQHGAVQAQLGNPAAAAKVGVDFVPSLNHVPIAEEIKWPRTGKWMAKYCLKGYDGLTQGELDELRVKYNIQDVSASELDFKIIYALVKSGYTQEAIREFWTRNGTKLYREDKESKNPNYFDMTFNKALEFVRAAASQKNPLAANKQSLVFTHLGQTFIQAGENVECILTAELGVHEIFEDQDATKPNEREWYRMTAKCSDANGGGVAEYPFVMPNEAFNSIQAFKSYTTDLFRVPTNNNAHLQRLASHLLQDRDIPRKAFHSKISYTHKSYVFPNIIIHADRIEVRENLPSDLQKKFPLLSQFHYEPLARAEVAAKLRQFWPDVLQMHLPRVIVSVLGSIVASAIRPRLLEAKKSSNFCIPTVNIRGASTTAKSETVRYLMTITGLDRQNVVLSARTSAFALARILENTNCLPVVIDEFKETDLDKRQVDIIREMTRRIYTGENMYRGQANLSVREIKIYGNFIVIGESILERSDNLSETSRVLPVQTDEYEPNKNMSRWYKLEEEPLYYLAPYLYQYLLTLDIAKAKDMFTALKMETRKQLENTIKNASRFEHNIAAIRFGCALLDDFIHTFDPTLPTIDEICKPTVNITEYLCQHVEKTGQALRYSNGNGSHEILNNNECLALLKTYGELIQWKHKIIMDMQSRGAFIFHEDGNELFINTKQAHAAYIEYSKISDQHTPPSMSKMNSIIDAAIAKKEGWVKDTCKLKKIKQHTVRVDVYNAKMLREMGIWPQQELILSAEELAQNTAQTPPIQAQNRIKNQLGLN